MSHMAKYAMLLVLAGLVVGCASGHYSEDTSASSPSSYGEAVKAPSTTDTRMAGDAGGNAQLASLMEVPRQVVKTGSLTVQVEAVDKGENQAREITERANGRVDRVESSDLAGPNPSISMTVRVPVGQFDDVMEDLEGIGVRMNKSVSAEDVTERIVDMEARLKIMLAQEDSLRKILAKSSSMENSLAVNRELMNLRGEIESMTAQRKSLASQAAFSTLNITLIQKATAEAVAATDPNWFQTSWANAWGAGVGAFRAMVGILMWLVVFSPIWIVAILVLRWLIRLASPPKNRAST